MALRRTTEGTPSARRGRRGHRASLALGLGLLGLVLGLLNVVAARHPTRADWTSTRRHTLSPKSVEVLRGLTRPVRVTLLMVPPDRLQTSLYHEVREVLRRFAACSPQILVEHVDLDASPTRAAVLAKAFALGSGDLREGAVLLESGGRRKSVSSAALAEREVRDGVERVVALKAEGALLEALLAVSAGTSATICFTRGHGEAPADSYAEAGYGLIVDEIKRDGHVTRVVGPEQVADGARGCSVLVVGGPQTAFAPVELDALDRVLRRGGRLLVLLGPVLDRRATRHGRVALEPLLAGWGVQLRENVVVDRLAVPGEQPLMTWATRDGYGEHPIARALAGRITVWPLTREVRPVTSLHAGLESSILVRTSEGGWAESDLSSLRGERPLLLDRAVDTPGPVPVAVAVRWRSTRIVVFGTERGVLNQRLSGTTVRDYNADLFLAAVGWLSGEETRVAVGPKALEDLRLTVDDRQLLRIFLITVIGMPCLGLSVGLLVWWRRRR